MGWVIGAEGEEKEQIECMEWEQELVYVQGTKAAQSGFSQPTLLRRSGTGTMSGIEEKGSLQTVYLRRKLKKVNVKEDSEIVK